MGLDSSLHFDSVDSDDSGASGSGAPKKLKWAEMGMGCHYCSGKHYRTDSLFYSRKERSYMTAVVKVENLVKEFGSKRAVDNVSFSLKKGQCGALLGPNGAGKTTTLKMLAGLLRPQSGNVTIGEVGAGEDYRHLIGYLPQYPVFFSWMTGREVLTYMGRLAGMSAKAVKERAEVLLKQVGISDAADREVGGYSGGMKQRLGIAQAMIHEPELVILDEPVSALDPVGRREMLDLIKELKKQSTILFSTHILHDVEELSDHIVIMHQGRIVVDSPMEQWMVDHQEPVLIIQAERNIDEWTESLRAESYVQHVERQGNQAKVTVTEMAHARRELLNHIIREGIPVKRFEVQQTSLEDFFLKVVRS